MTRGGGAGGAGAVSAEFSKKQSEKDDENIDRSPAIDSESSLKCDRIVSRRAQRPCAWPALPSSVPRMSGSARQKYVVSALSLSDLHLNAAASVYLLWGEPVPHDWFWLIPSDFHVDLHHFTLTLPPPWPCLRLERDGWRGNFCQKYRYIISCFSSEAAH